MDGVFIGPCVLQLFVCGHGTGRDSVRLGTAISKIEGKEHRSDLIDEEGRRHGPFDLVILADGSRSALRDQTPLVRRAARYRRSPLVYRENPEGHFQSTLFPVVKGTRKCSVSFPPVWIRKARRPGEPVLEYQRDREARPA